MPRAKSKSDVSSESSALGWRWTLIGTVALATAIAVGAGLYLLRRSMERSVLLADEPLKVVLKNRPAWMTDLLAERIARLARPAGAHSALDQEMLRNAYDRLKANPWIKKLRQVRRVYGEKPGDTLEIDCDFRQPIALVHYGYDYYLVDDEAVQLPEKYSPADVPAIMFSGRGADRRINIRVIEGVQSPRPQEPGQKWAGTDLAAGLELVHRLYDLPFADEIEQVNVANIDGRVTNTEAQITLGTRYGSTIKWGEPVKAVFHAELKPDVKFRTLELIKAQYKRVDAKPDTWTDPKTWWLDIRFEGDIRCPPQGSAQVDTRNPR